MGPGIADAAVTAAVARHLRGAGGAMPASELTAGLLRDGFSAPDVRDALTRLAAEQLIVVIDNVPFDPHLSGVDLRVVAGVVDGDESTAEARRRAEACWNRQVREFLATHRCG